nr:hypothetical protein [Pseudonocardia sp. AL041005-10]
MFSRKTVPSATVPSRPPIHAVRRNTSSSTTTSSANPARNWITGE